VVDPDRNVNLAAEDTVLLSVEVSGGPEPSRNDVEMFLLKETGKNTSVFRGYVDTQPGRGREVRGVVEVTPGQQAIIGYMDLADAQGTRNPVYRLRLPVVAGVVNLASAK